MLVFMLVLVLMIIFRIMNPESCVLLSAIDDHPCEHEQTGDRQTLVE
jgi:hypothetical protein